LSGTMYVATLDTHPVTRLIHSVPDQPYERGVRRSQPESQNRPPPQSIVTATRASDRRYLTGPATRMPSVDAVYADC
jgi:hypothetical protein